MQSLLANKLEYFIKEGDTYTCKIKACKAKGIKFQDLYETQLEAHLQWHF